MAKRETLLIAWAQTIRRSSLIPAFANIITGVKNVLQVQLQLRRMNDYQAYCSRHAYDDTNVIAPMKLLTVSVYDAEHLIINEMAIVTRKKLLVKSYCKILRVPKIPSSILVCPSLLLNIGQNELITFDRKAPLG